MSLRDMVRTYINMGYDLGDSNSCASQDIVLLKISKSNFKNHITIKGGVVMHSISSSIRRVTRDLDLDFIKYSLDDEKIKEFINKLNSVNDGITISIEKEIEELHHQDYNGRRVYISISDNDYVIKTKLDIGVHKWFNIEQEEYYFNLDSIGNGVSLLINSPEQIFTEKLKSLLKLGFRSTRYKDIFDLYYLIISGKLKKNKLKQIFNTLIFCDETIRENSTNDIAVKLRKTFNNKIYQSNLNNPKVNWLDISINEAINEVLNYIESLAIVPISI